MGKKKLSMVQKNQPTIDSFFGSNSASSSASKKKNKKKKKEAAVEEDNDDTINYDESLIGQTVLKREGNSLELSAKQSYIPYKVLNFDNKSEKFVVKPLNKGGSRKEEKWSDDMIKWGIKLHST